MTDRQQPGQGSNAMTGAAREHDREQAHDAEPGNTYRPPEYAVVISASDWVKEHFPAAGANLWDALRTGKDRHRNLEPDLEAEP
jgi:hypothetical protein